MELPPSPFFQGGWHCPPCCGPRRPGIGSHAWRRMGMGKRGGQQPWLPAHLHPSLGMARGWRPRGRQGRAARIGPGRLAEQLSLHRGGRRPLCAINYANIGKCVERRMPCGAEDALCDALPARPGRRKAGSRGQRGRGGLQVWACMSMRGPGYRTRGQLPAGNRRLGWLWCAVQ